MIFVGRLSDVWNPRDVEVSVNFNARSTTHDSSWFRLVGVAVRFKGEINPPSLHFKNFLSQSSKINFVSKQNSNSKLSIFKNHFVNLSETVGKSVPFIIEFGTKKQLQNWVKIEFRVRYEDTSRT